MIQALPYPGFALFLVSISFGATPKPWPTVLPSVLSAGKVTIDIPEVGLACTVDATLPSLLVTVVAPLSFQFHAARVSPLPLTPATFVPAT